LKIFQNRGKNDKRRRRVGRAGYRGGRATIRFQSETERVDDPKADNRFSIKFYPNYKPFRAFYKPPTPNFEGQKTFFLKIFISLNCLVCVFYNYPFWESATVWRVAAR
jgi:hypothetical protein